MGAQSTTPLGSPDSIRVETQRLIREMGRGSGLNSDSPSGVHHQRSTPTSRFSHRSEGESKKNGRLRSASLPLQVPHQVEHHLGERGVIPRHLRDVVDLGAEVHHHGHLVDHVVGARTEK